MKKTIIAAALVALAGLVACNKETADVTPAPDSVKDAVLTVNVASAQTKASGVTSADEATVNNIQYLVFTKADGKIDAYTKVTPTATNTATSATLACSSGEKVVYAIVNADEDYSAVQTKAALLAKVSLLKNNSTTSFVMDGSKEVTLPQTSTVSIDVNRMAARVMVKKITSAFEAVALRNLDMTIDAIYITNVAGEQNLGHSLSTYSVWFNQLAYSTSDVDALTYEAITGVNLKPESSATSASTEVAHSFYAYPNASEATTEGGTWSARHTRLVVEATIGEEKVYYPITLPVLESNKSYEINELIITRRGSSSPDVTVSVADATFDITVKDWTQVLVTGDRDTTDGNYTI